MELIAQVTFAIAENEEDGFLLFAPLHVVASQYRGKKKVKRSLMVSPRADQYDLCA